MVIQRIVLRLLITAAFLSIGAYLLSDPNPEMGTIGKSKPFSAVPPKGLTTVREAKGISSGKHANENSQDKVIKIKSDQLLPNLLTKTFYSDWRIQAKTRQDLYQKLTQILLKSKEWPKQIELSDLESLDKTPPRPRFENEARLFLRISYQGLVVPQATIKALAFKEPGQDSYRINYLKTNLELPPKGEVQRRIEVKEAITMAAIDENTRLMPWRVQKQWHKMDKRWFPAWVVQFPGSANRYFIDMESGSLHKAKESLGAEHSHDFSAQGWIHEDEGGGNNLKLASLPELSSKELQNEAVVVYEAMDRAPLLEVIDLSPSQALFNSKKLPSVSFYLDVLVNITKVYNYFVNHLALEILKDKPIVAQVNVNLGRVGAALEGGSIFFHRETKISKHGASSATIAYHEYAHYADVWTEGIQDNALSEGLADMTAFFITKQPLLAAKFFKNPEREIRNAENNKKFDYQPRNNDPEDPKIFYPQSEAWSGFAWDVRKWFIERYGEEKGQQEAEDLLFTPLFMSAAHIPEAVEMVFARNAFGGPIIQARDYDLLKKAADRHGFILP